MGAHLKFSKVIDALFEYARKHGKAYLFWDHSQGAPRARARGSHCAYAEMIGCYTIATDVRDILDDIAAYQAERGLRSHNRRTGPRK